MIIKAGTYRFNDELTFSDELPGWSFALNFSIPPFKYSGGVVPQTFCNKMFPSQSSNDLTYYLVDGSYSIVYYQNNKFNHTAVLLGDASVNGYGQIITVIDDFTSSNTDEEAFVTWFTENTEEVMLIKAGTYKWNDTLTEYPIGEIQFNAFIPRSYTFDGQNVTFTDTPQPFETIKFSNQNASFEMALVHSYSDSGASHIVSVATYDTNYGWDSGYYFLSNYGIDVPEMKGYGQTITITEDTYVPTDFGLWATSNWQPYSESKPAVEIVYKDKVITLKAGQTARLHNADGSPFGFEEDLVIKANEGAAEAPKLQQKEVLIEVNGVGTKVLPDEGYDGLSAVLVSVAIPETTPNYQLCGKWKFKDTVSNPSVPDLEQEINFTSGEGKSCTKMVVAVYDDATEIEYYYDDGQSNIRYDSSYTPYWKNDNAKIVDYGKTLQNVSKEYYEWVTTNAEIYIVITVATVDDLPTDSADGTIAIVEG